MIGMMKHNLGMKVLAFVLAIVAWGFTRAMDPIENWQLDLDVDVLLKQGTVALAHEDLEQMRVTVNVTGPASRLQRLQNGNPRAVLNCRNLPIGEEEEVPFRLDRSPMGIQIDFVPETIKVTVDEFTSRFFEAEVIKLGSIPPGLEIESIRPEHPSIKVEGASSQIDHVDRVIYYLDQWSLSIGTTELQVEFTPVDLNNDLVEFLEVTPQTQQIEINLDSLDYWPIIVDVEYRSNPPPNYRITSVWHEPLEVEVGGALEIRKGIGSISTVPVDLTGRIKSFSEEVAIDPPDEVTILPGQDHVTVHVEIVPIFTVYEFSDLSIEVIDDYPGNYVVEIPDNRVTVVVQALPSRRTPLSANEINPQINISGLQPGDNDVAVYLQLPPNVQMVSIVPEKILVRVREQQQHAIGPPEPVIP